MGASPSSEYYGRYSELDLRKPAGVRSKSVSEIERRRDRHMYRRRKDSSAAAQSSPRFAHHQTTAYITPYDIRQMMSSYQKGAQPEPDEHFEESSLDGHQDVSPADEENETQDENERPGRVRLNTKLSVHSQLSQDSGIMSSAEVSPRGSIDNGRSDEQKENGKTSTKKKRRLFSKKAIGKRFRSKSITALFRIGEKPAPLFGTSYLNREWEIVTVQEMCRRLSLDHLDVQDMPLPDGASQSQVLDELMIRQIMEILPARAEGYPWVNIYNSEKHGFSLATLYRKMAEFDEDMSPVLLIIRDTRERVFGCVVSTAIRPADHYFGTGDACLLWRFTGEAPHTRELRHYTWTGENQFFVNAAKDSLSVGAGGGQYGIWLDADLNHGRTQRCETFDNEPLTGDSSGDFIVQFIEAYGFRM